MPSTLFKEATAAPAGVDAARALPGEATPRWLRSAAVRLVLMLAVFAVISALLSGIHSGVGGNAVGSLLVGVLASVLALYLYRVAVQVTERRRAVELPASTARSGLWGGTVTGFALFTVVIVAIAVFGGYQLLGWGSFGGMLATLGLMCVVATTEELLFRGVLFRLVEELAGTWGALAVSAVFFGLVHMTNPHVTLWGAVAIAIEAGLMLGAAYAATRSLWLPIGLHLGWNATQAGIFGTVVSATDRGWQGLFEGTTSGPTLLTGGAVGPEASIFAIIACLVPTVVFLRLAQRRGHIYGRRRRAGAPQAS